MMMSLSQQLAISLIRSWLNALVLSETAADDVPGSLKKGTVYSIAPNGRNQYSWPEMAARMGENSGKNRRCGKVDSVLMAQS